MFKEGELTKEEKELIKKVSTDKAKNITTIAFLLITINLLTYAIPLIWGIFDLGMVFEIVSLLLLINARRYMLEYDAINAKKYTYYSIIVITRTICI